MAGAPQARGVHQDVVHPFTAKKGVNGVPGGAGLGAHQEALFSQKIVDQGGFPHVGPADDGHPDPRGRGGEFPGQRQDLPQGLQQARKAQAVGGRHGVEVCQAELVELRQPVFQCGKVDLVHHQEDGLGGAPEVVHHLGIAGLGALAAVHHQENSVGLLHRSFGLLPHHAGQIFFAPHQTAGIYQQDGMVIPGEAGVMTVPGDPGDIGHQGLGGAGEAVEEGGLPHVGPADDGHQGLLGRN